MTDLATSSPLEWPVAAALASSHASLALTRGFASKYPTAVAPFAALWESSPRASADLHALLAPGETVFLETPPPSHPGLVEGEPVPCVQMRFPEDCPVPNPAPATDRRPPAIAPLTCADSPAMLALIAVAFPGYFRPETCRMGRYFGVWDAPEPGDATSHTLRQPPRLLGMVGERMIAAPFREISALAVHPAAAGRGMGTALLCHMLALHRAEASLSWLFATVDNTRAIRLYERLGFAHTRRIDMCRLTRVE